MNEEVAGWEGLGGDLAVGVGDADDADGELVCGWLVGGAAEIEG